MKDIETLLNEMDSRCQVLNKQEAELLVAKTDFLRDACKLFLHKYKTNEVTFDYDEADAPCGYYNGCDECEDAYITRLYFDKDGYPVDYDIYCYYTGKTIEKAGKYNCDFDHLGIAGFVLDQVENGRYEDSEDSEDSED